MAIVRTGQQGVLLVVDVQVGVVREAWDAGRIIGNMAFAVDRARQAGVPVVWVQHHDHNLAQGSADWQWVPELVPAPGETRIFKSHNSAFEQTPLEAELARLGASHITLAGASTNWCIRATAYAALERGYDLTLVRDAHTTDTVVLASGQRLEAADVVQELNLAMRWLSYPGRANGTSPAQTVDFSTPGGTKD